MKKARLAFVGLGIATAIGVWACGGTGGGLGDSDGGTQFVSITCTPDSDCLTLNVKPLFLAGRGDEARFSARLVDANGAPGVGEKICFALEDASAADIFEPSSVEGNCGTTDSNGQVSGGLRSTGRRSGSIIFFATMDSRGLRVQKTLKFGPGCLLDLQPKRGDVDTDGSLPLRACVTCSDSTVLVGETISFSGCGGACSITPGAASTGNDGCARGTLINTNAGATSVAVEVTASGPTAGSDASDFVMKGMGTPTPVATATPVSTTTPVPTDTPPPTATPKPGGASCTLGAQCGSGICRPFPGCGFPSCCTFAPGDPCAPDGSNPQCTSGTCTLGSCT